MDPPEKAKEMEAGVPQGAPSSPVLWAIITNLVLEHVRLTGKDGYTLGKGGDASEVRQLAYVDDITPVAATREGIIANTDAVNRMYSILGVRMSAAKRFVAWSPAVEANGGGWGVDSGRVFSTKALDDKGRYRVQAFTPVPPRGDARGRKPEHRGAMRSLGVWFSFQGCGTDRGRFQESHDRISAKMDDFFATMGKLRPTLPQFRAAVTAVFLARAAYPLLVTPYGSELVDRMRGKITATALQCLNLGHNLTPSRTSALVMSWREHMGFGLPDPLNRLLSAELALVREGLGSTDERLRAAVLTQLRGVHAHAEDDGKYTVFRTRLRRLAAVGVDIHRGSNGRVGSEIPPVPLPDVFWDEGARARAMADTQIACLNTKD